MSEGAAPLVVTRYNDHHETELAARSLWLQDLIARLEQSVIQLSAKVKDLQTDMRELKAWREEREGDHK